MLPYLVFLFLAVGVAFIGRRFGSLGLRRVTIALVVLFLVFLLGLETSPLGPIPIITLTGCLRSNLLKIGLRSGLRRDSVSWFWLEAYCQMVMPSICFSSLWSLSHSTSSQF